MPAEVVQLVAQAPIGLRLAAVPLTKGNGELHDLGEDLILALDAFELAVEAVGGGSDVGSPVVLEMEVLVAGNLGDYAGGDVVLAGDLVATQTADTDVLDDRFAELAG